MYLFLNPGSSPARLGTLFRESLPLPSHVLQYASHGPTATASISVRSCRACTARKSHRISTVLVRCPCVPGALLAYQKGRTACGLLARSDQTLVSVLRRTRPACLIAVTFLRTTHSKWGCALKCKRMRKHQHNQELHEHKHESHAVRSCSPTAQTKCGHLWDSVLSIAPRCQGRGIWRSCRRRSPDGI